MLGAAREPAGSRILGTATASALLLGSVVRMFAWFFGDYYVFLGEAPRLEAGIFLAIALALVWLRPRRRSTAGAAQ